jgi:hypothetical protein
MSEHRPSMTKGSSFLTLFSLLLFHRLQFTQKEDPHPQTSPQNHSVFAGEEVIPRPASPNQPVCRGLSHPYRALKS